jgi:general secretion pathway protein G
MKIHLTPRPLARAVRSAFTLMEMILVLAIIAILIAIGASTLGEFDEQAKITAARAQIGTVSTAVKMYKVNNRNLPPSLDALVKPPGNVPVKKPFIEENGIIDPWDNKYIYKSPGKDGKAYEIYSAGQDKREGTDDDVH